MPNDRAANDPKQIWQSQPKEVSVTTLERMIRRRAEDLHSKTLRERLSSVAAPVAVAAFSAFAISVGFNPIAFAIAMGWSLAGAYVLNRGSWPVKPAADAGMSTGLEFCRKEIERQTYIHRRFLVWSFAPIILATGAFAALAIQEALKKHAVLANVVPFCSMLVLWIIGIFIVRSRRWRTMQRAIEELNDIEKENRR